MKFVRMLFVIIDMSIFAAGALFIGVVIFPLLSLFIKGKKRREYFSAIIHYSWKLFIRIMEITGEIRVNINGDLSAIKGKIVAASHPSLIDIILLIGNMPKSLCIAKKEILKNPFMRNIVKFLYIVNDDPEVFQKNAKEALEDGYNIVIFPTGTRTLPDENLKIHKGAAQLAITSGVNIVPVTIETDYPFLIKSHSPFDAGSKTVNYSLTVLSEIKTEDYIVKSKDGIKARNAISEKIKECLTLRKN